MDQQDQLYEFATMGVFLDAVTDVLGRHSRVEEVTRRAMFSCNEEDYCEAERCFDLLPVDIRDKVSGRAEERAHEVVVNAEIDRIRRHFSLPAAHAIETATAPSYANGTSNDTLKQRSSSQTHPNTSLTSYIDGR